MDKPMTTDEFISALMNAKNPDPYTFYDAITEWHKENWNAAIIYLNDYLGE